MLVFVEDAAESVVSSDVDSVESVGLDDRLGERAQGCRGAERAVGPVLVVEGFVFAQRMEKMGLVSRSRFGRGVRHGSLPAENRAALAHPRDQVAGRADHRPGATRHDRPGATTS